MLPNRLLYHFTLDFLYHPAFPRMMLAMNFFKARAVDVRIDLRGRYVRVSEHRLNRAEIRTAFEQMGGKGMA